MVHKVFGVYGAGGFGREVMPIARTSVEGHRLVFVDDSGVDATINGHSAVTFEEFLKGSADSRSVCLAIADHKARRELAEKCLANSVSFYNVIAPNSVIFDAVDMGEGAIICSFVTLTSNIKIGKHFHANLYSYVAHDCIIGDYVTFAPSVKCNGNVVIEDGAYIGTGAVIKPGSRGKPVIIGAGAVVGMGAVVTKSIPAGAVVIGNPAKPLV